MAKKQSGKDSSTSADLRRVGVVDVGSNSVRLVVFDGAARSPAYFYNEKIMCRLGADMAQTGRLNAEGRVRALEALRRFQALSRQMGTGELHAVATAAVREASDGKDFCREVKRETGLVLNVIDGTEEARFSAQGVLLGWPGSYGLVCDIGGSSMELAEIRDGRVGKCLTSPLGPLTLAGQFSSREDMRAHIREVILDMQEKLGPQHDRLFLVGGSWRAIARIDMHRRAYPLKVLHEYRMTVESLRETIDLIAREDPETLQRACGISASRMALVPDASMVLRELIEILGPHDIAASSYGLREGLLYERMPDVVRDSDPLIAACRATEKKDARVPGFGDRLYKFLRPLFPDVGPERRRIIHAACLLHDVSWRAHPDYRSELCFDNATRANLGGLTHEERVFLGLALMFRYSGKRTDTQFARLFDLIPPEDQTEAEVLGKAMRLGAMLWIEGDGGLGRLTWTPKKRRLELDLKSRAGPLFGEVPRARLQALAEVLNAAEVIAPAD